MLWLTLEHIKQQCRIEPDFHEEDELLCSYGDTAEKVVLNHLARTYEDIIEAEGGIPGPIDLASRMLVDTFYKHRSPAEAQSFAIVPYGNIDILLKPYMQL